MSLKESEKIRKNLKQSGSIEMYPEKSERLKNVKNLKERIKKKIKKSEGI